MNSSSVSEYGLAISKSYWMTATVGLAPFATGTKDVVAGQSGATRTNVLVIAFISSLANPMLASPGAAHSRPENLSEAFACPQAELERVVKVVIQDGPDKLSSPPWTWSTPAIRNTTCRSGPDI